MTMPFVYPGSFSSFVPAATGMLIAAVRDPETYKINKIMQLVQAPKDVFIWTRMHFDDLGQRGLTTNAEDEGVWQDGHDAPLNNQNTQRFTSVEAQTIRRTWDFKLGWKTIENADLPVLNSHTLMVRNQAMTNITRRAVNVLTTTANWPTTNVADATVLNGGAGFWDQASSDPDNPNYLAIKKTIDTVVERIRLVTNNAFDLDEKSFKLMMSPNTARKISQTAEIHDYMKGSPDARTILEKSLGNYGLPPTLYGVEVVVEPTGMIAGHAEADGSAAAIGSTGRKYVFPDNKVVLISRVGGLDGKLGPTFSTISRFYHDKEAAVEVEDDKWNRTTKGRVVIDDTIKLTCGESGFLINNIFG